MAMVLTAVMTLGLTSCHTSKNATKGGEMNKRNGWVSEDWSKLDIKLDSKDNTKLYKEVKGWLGTPYKYAGHSKDGADCSGFVMEVYNSVYNKAIERNSAKIFEKNCKEIDKDDLREGDLVFFNNGNDSNINHVGIYLKQGKFAHASSSRGVVISDLAQNYYVKHFQVAGRVKK
jgi:cell wall-associated NlpC family hydrolase